MTEFTEPEPYAVQPDLQPDVSLDITQVEQSVIDETPDRSYVRPIVAGLAALVLAGGAWGAYKHWGGHDTTAEIAATPNTFTGEPSATTPNGDICYSPAVEKTFPGDPSVISDDPADWTKGVLLNIASPNVDGYLGVTVGFHGPAETIDDATWSDTISPDQLDGEPALMRTGHDSYTIAVASVGDEGSAVCGEKPKVTFKKTDVAKALDDGVVEPQY